MPDRHLPRYPVYVISKGRADVCKTADFLARDGVPFHLVVEPQERELYASRYGAARVRELPFANLGQGSIPARNWVWEHAKAAGVGRHWILDDNIKGMRRWFRGRRLPCAAGPAMAATEDFVDRYENLAVAGLNYEFFCRGTAPPFVLNVHVYSCMLIQCDLPHRWRGRYNEDTDLCLQVLSGGMCTALINVFCIDKMGTMKVKGGNTAELYKGDGRLRMARSLERAWPYVVETKRRFNRPQHVVRDAWRKFDTPLRRKPGVVVPSTPNEYGMTLAQVAPEVRAPGLRALIDEFRGRGR